MVRTIDKSNFVKTSWNTILNNIKRYSSKRYGFALFLKTYKNILIPKFRPI